MSRLTSFLNYLDSEFLQWQIPCWKFPEEQLILCWKFLEVQQIPCWKFPRERLIPCLRAPGGLVSDLWDCSCLHSFTPLGHCLSVFTRPKS